MMHYQWIKIYSQSDKTIIWNCARNGMCIPVSCKEAKIHG